MPTFVALLRGINVGGRVALPMAGLRDSLSALGLEDVTTYIQSGNVVFRSPAADPEAHAAAIEERIAADFGLDVSVLVRTPEELADVAARNPFLGRQDDLTKLHVVFLSRAPDADAVARLDPGRSPPDELSVHGREIYLLLPNGAGRSKLTNDYLERTLGVRATARNWKTVTKLLELAR